MQRRAHDRYPTDVACKVFDPRSRKYLPARACNVSAGGALIEVERRRDFEPDQTLQLGLPRGPGDGFILAGDLIDASVVRCANSTEGSCWIALKFAHAVERPMAPLSLAA